MRGGATGMGAAAAASAAVGQMSGLSSSADKAASAVASAAAAMQFPLTQRRKRRVLFTQAQVCLPLGETFFNGILNTSKNIDIDIYRNVMFNINYNK